MFINKHIKWLPALIWMAIIFYLSHQAGTQSSQLSGGITDFLWTFSQFLPLQEETFHTIIRKSAHFTAYFILGTLTFYALYNKNLFKNATIAWIIATLYAGTDEYHQTFIPGRSGEVRDVIIDSAGALTGIISIILIISIFKKARLRKA